MLNCPENQVILALHSGKLPDEEIVTVAEHVAKCPACQRVSSSESEVSSSDPILDALRGTPCPDRWDVEVAGQRGIVRARKLWASQFQQSIRGGNCLTTQNGGVSLPLTNPPHISDSISPGDATIPSHINRFLVRRRLGQGSFGAVYLVEDPMLGREVAIKVPKATRSASQNSMDALHHEAQKAAQLRHPGIVTIHDVVRDGTSICIVMEYVDGQDLDAWSAERPRSWQEIVRVLAEVAEAVDYAHRQGLVHRDLKPGNILVDTGGVAKVTDFGLAVHENEQWAHAGEISGTPAYMSPEQFEGKAHFLDGRSDIWSLGVILYELLTERRPFSGSFTVDLREEILHRDPKALRVIRPTIPRELESIVLKCLKRPIADRYATAGDLAADLRHFLKPAEHHRRWWLVTTVLLVLLAVLGGIVGSKFAWHAAPSPLSVISMDIGQLLMDDKGEFPSRGNSTNLTPDDFQVRLADAVDIRCQLSRPAYCFLLAFCPDGKVVLCLPLDDGQPPPLTDSLSYPNDPAANAKEKQEAWRLSDGTGEQAFVLIASDTPLPSYREWRLSLGEFPWEPSGDLTAPTIRHHNGRSEQSLSVKGPGGRRSLENVPVQGRSKSALDELVQWFQAHGKFAAIEARSFTVLPRDET